MPRRSQQDKARSHDQIVEVAAARIRQDGTTAPSVAEIMQAAGLTHGGFYKHFDSRDELIAEAVDRAFADSQTATATVIDEAEDPLKAFVEWYVSTEHRDDPASGCGVVTLGAEAARADARVRAAYTEQVKRYLAQLEQLLGGGSDAGTDATADPDVRRQATVMLATLVGAVLVSRAVDDPALSDEIISDVRAAIVTERGAG
ncbi:MAG TPA: TetR/AcrR family transcriptional regulator [Solirubrobacteraceae bacterium]|nr:TetR/AcrR family transcriptional regulator [Solirubrobacteraceae bacterium]